MCRTACVARTVCMGACVSPLHRCTLNSTTRHPTWFQVTDTERAVATCPYRILIGLSCIATFNIIGQRLEYLSNPASVPPIIGDQWSIGSKRGFFVNIKTILTRMLTQQHVYTCTALSRSTSDESLRDECASTRPRSKRQGDRDYIFLAHGKSHRSA